MSREVFISHAVEDRSEAKAICDGLEHLGVSCWIAPRDIKPGAIWAQALIDGVAECSVMVVVLSEHANRSQAVIAEVDAASKRDRRIVAVRIRDVSPEGALEFYLGRSHWLDAVHDSLHSCCQALAREFSAGVAQPRTPPESRSAEGGAATERHVQVFFHRAEVEQTSIMAAQIANRLEADGWLVTRGQTTLAIHSNGVWVHGATDPARAFALRLLAEMGLEGQVDDREENVPLQIIVGRVGHRNVRTAPRDKPTPVARDADHRIEWTTDGSGTSSVPRLAVRLHLVENVGGTHGFLIKAISDEPETLEAARVTITDILRWSDQHGRFVMSRDIYDSGTNFRALETAVVTMHPGETVTAGFVRCEDHGAEFNGKTDDQPQARYRVQTAGIWQVKIRVQAQSGRNQDGCVCFRWIGGDRIGAFTISQRCPDAK